MPNPDVDPTAETEVQRIQKQLRKMEKDRVAFVEEKKRKNLIKLKIIETLKAERNALRDRLNTIQDGPHAKRTLDLEGEMKRLLDERAIVQQSCNEHKLNLWEVNGNIQKLEKELGQLHAAEVTEPKYQEQIVRVQQSVAKLENQLDVVNKRWGDVMAENASLRKTIDHILLERTHFNAMWQRIVGRLEQGKRYIVELIDQSTVAYDQREELCNKIQGLREKSMTEGSVHLQEMRELQRKLDYDAKMQQFFSVKGNRRQNADLEQREAFKKQQQQQHFQQKIDDYTRLLENIHSLSDEPDPQKLAEYFKKQEEENFALFSYVNELSNEVETLNDAVQLVKAAIAKQLGENEHKEKSKMESVEVLKKQLAEQKDHANQKSEVQANIETRLAELLYGVEKIFKLIRCGDAPVLELLNGGGELGATGGGADRPLITINNVRLFLGIVRRRSSQLINAVNAADQTVRILARKDRIPKFNIRDK